MRLNDETMRDGVVVEWASMLDLGCVGKWYLLLGQGLVLIRQVIVRTLESLCIPNVLVVGASSKAGMEMRRLLWETLSRKHGACDVLSELIFVDSRRCGDDLYLRLHRRCDRALIGPLDFFKLFLRIEADGEHGGSQGLVIHTPDRPQSGKHLRKFLRHCQKTKLPVATRIARRGVVICGH